MQTNIKAVSASAGSGKTYTLTQTLLDKIKSRELKPENLVAVTFTEAGASELKSRIRAVLLKEGLFEEAQQVEDSYISTIHAFGFRLLKELAFDMGLPLSSRMLNEDEQTQLIRTSMVGSQALTEMSNELDKYGYTTKRTGSKFIPAESVFREHLQEFIDLLRSTGRDFAEDDFLKRSVDWIAQRYGTVALEEKAEDLAKGVHRCVLALLKEFPECPIDKFEVEADSAIKGFQDSYRSLERAAQFDPLLTDWSLWAKLSNIKIGFKGSKGKPGYLLYKELAEALKDTVDANFLVHPGPLKQSTKHLEMLLAGASETLQGYAERKRESALLDFTDMVAHAEQALRNDSNRQRLLDCIRMAVVDEFQDTNPIQFAFLWHLIGSGIPSVLVGDVKQSIMGFQGADPRLFEALIADSNVSVSSLESNWRSQPKLLDVINALTQGLAGPDGMKADYTPLKARAKDSPLNPLHVVVFDNKPDSNRKKEGEESSVIHPSELMWRARNLAQVLKEKLQGKHQVIDRKTGLKRALKGGDIAVLCPTNGMLATYSRVFETAGLAVNLERQGWFDTEEVQLAIHLLTLLANPEDKHAQLMVAHSDLGQMTLQQAMEALMQEGGLGTLPVMRQLDVLREPTASLLMKEVVELVLERTGLIDLASTWPDHVQARANLFKLIGLGREFSDAHAETLASAGFHGKGIGTFIGWLHFMNVQGKEDLCPRASYNDEHAIELTTWHKSKGREWPIVLVAGMDKSPKVSLPDVAIGYEDFKNFGAIIEKSQIEFSPAYDCKPKCEDLLETLLLAAEKVALRELYVALSRPRDQLMLEWLPDHLKSEAKSKRRIQLLESLTQFKVQDKTVTIQGQEFPAVVDRIVYAIDKANFEPRADIDVAPAKVVGRLAIQARPMSLDTKPAQISPSQLRVEVSDEAPSDSKFKVSRISDSIEFEQTLQMSELGTDIHRVLEIVLSGHEEHLKSPEVIAAFGARQLSPQHLEQLVALGKNIRSQFENEPGTARVYVEQVVMGPSGESDTVAVGQVDCFISGKQGGVVIDHKSGVLAKDPQALWDTYRVQLEVYGELFGDARYGLVRVRAGEVLESLG